MGEYGSFSVYGKKTWQNARNYSVCRIFQNVAQDQWHVSQRGRTDRCGENRLGLVIYLHKLLGIVPAISTVRFCYNFRCHTSVRYVILYDSNI